MEDPFLKIRRKVCGEWLVPPPVVAGNLNTFLHRICSTQLTICCQLAIFPLICYANARAAWKHNTFLAGCGRGLSASNGGSAWLSRDQKDGRLTTSARPLAKSSRMGLVASLEFPSLKSCSFFHDEFEMKSCCYCLKFTWNCLTNCFVSGEIRTVLLW
jgi:hypothetical protein